MNGSVRWLPAKFRVLILIEGTRYSFFILKTLKRGTNINQQNVKKQSYVKHVNCMETKKYHIFGPHFYMMLICFIYIISLSQMLQISCRPVKHWLTSLFGLCHAPPPCQSPPCPPVSPTTSSSLSVCLFRSHFPSLVIWPLFILSPNRFFSKVKNDILGRGLQGWSS